jgi:cobalt/nickel transport system permease protein
MTCGSPTDCHPWPWFSMMTLWAVHIADGVLSLSACVVGFALAALLAALGAWRLRDDEVPRVAVLTSAFFIASSLRVPLPPSSVHLLLNGLVGIVLGWRVGLAIPVGLVLQAVLLGHGGFVSLGVNAVVMVLPALVACAAYRVLRRLSWQDSAWLRATLVGLGAILWTVSLVFGLLLLFARDPDSEEAKRDALEQLLQPATLVLLALFGIVAVAVERRLNRSPDFAIGLLIGLLTVLLTSALSLLALLYGGATNWTRPAWLLFVAHLPLAALEGLILGFTVSFLARVKPEMLANGFTSPAAPEEALERPRPAAPPTGRGRG